MLPRGQALRAGCRASAELEIARRRLGDDGVVQFEARVAALEIEAGGQLAVGLVDGVGQFVLVDFGNHIEGGHGGRLAGRWSDSSRSGMARRLRDRCTGQAAAFGDNRGMPKSCINAPRCASALLAAETWPPRRRGAAKAGTLHVGDADYRVVELDLAPRHAGTALARRRRQRRWRASTALRRWGEAHGRELLFATNAGIYDREFRPLGLYIEEGVTLRPLNTSRGAPGSGNFAIQPNGVFYVDAQGRAGVCDHGGVARAAHRGAPGDAVGADAGRRRRDQSELRRAVGQPQMAQRRVCETPRERDLCGQRSAGDVPCVRASCSAINSAVVTRCIWTEPFRDLHQGGGYAGAPALMLKPYAAMLAVFASDAASEK